jgi:hypothetical protein
MPVASHTIGYSAPNGYCRLTGAAAVLTLGLHTLSRDAAGRQET